MTAGHLEFHHQPASRGIWHSLNRLLFVLIVFSVTVAVGHRFIPEVSRGREQDARAARLKEEIDGQRLLLARNVREEFLLRHDRAYLEMVARDKLDLMKEGETIYRMEPVRPDKSQMRLNK